MSYHLSRGSIKGSSDPSFINYPGSEDIPEELKSMIRITYGLRKETHDIRQMGYGILCDGSAMAEIHRALLEQLEH